MNIKALNALVMDGKIKIAINQLVEHCENVGTPYNVDVFQIKARFCWLEKENNLGISSNYILERNNITRSLLEIVECFAQTTFHQSFTLVQAKETVESLAMEFRDYETIMDTLTRLRLKNQCCKKIAKLLEQFPALIQQFQTSDLEGIIGGIAEKIKSYPNMEDLNILEQLARNTQKHFIRGTIACAIREIIYSGQLRLGDEVKIKKILQLLDNQPDMPLKKNIESVKASLTYLRKTNPSNIMA